MSGDSYDIGEDFYMISKKKYMEYCNYINKQIVPDPPDDLREMYEQRVLVELSFLRAEKFDSPEHREELKNIAKNGEVPRNIQNGNYDQLIKYYKAIVKSNTPLQVVSHCIKIKEFLEKIHKRVNTQGTNTQLGKTQGFLPFIYKPKYLNYSIDVRCCDTLELYFNYMITLKLHQLTDKFEKLTNNIFPVEDISSTIRFILASISNNGKKVDKEEYIKNINDIYSLLNDNGLNLGSFQIKENKIGVVDDCKTIEEFFNFIWSG